MGQAKFKWHAIGTITALDALLITLADAPPIKTLRENRDGSYEVVWLQGWTQHSVTVMAYVVKVAKDDGHIQRVTENKRSPDYRFYRLVQGES